MLEDEKERKKCIEVVEEARERVEKMVSWSLTTLRLSLFEFPAPFSGDANQIVSCLNRSPSREDGSERGPLLTSF